MGYITVAAYLRGGCGDEPTHETSVADPASSATAHDSRVRKVSFCLVCGVVSLAAIKILQQIILPELEAAA